MTLDPAHADLVGTTLAGKYRVISLIGGGGMGSVFEVEHLVTRRIGALKLLHPVYAARGDVVTRFIREASAAARIGDPHIVESFDAGTLPSGAPYIFMELLKGNSLAELIERRRRLPFAEARDLVAQAAAALESAHRQGIIHRDVKPENLFVCEGSVPFVKILDFGICKLLDDDSGIPRLTQEGAPLGTPHYMSREQVVGAEITFRTDIHALGVVLYECLTGEVPYHANTLSALAVKIFEGEYPRATELAPDLPPAVDTLLATAMAREPQHGFASMSAFRAALAALEAPREVTAQNPSEARPRRSRLRTLWLILGLTGLGGGSALFVGSRGEAGPKPPVSVPRSTPTRVQSASPSAPPTSPSVSSSAPVQTSPAASGSPASPSMSGARPRAPSPTRAPTRAERDGLTRENPFE